MAFKDAKLIKKINLALYEAEAGSYNARHPEVIEGDRKWWEDFGLEFINGRKGIKILDIGSGTGFVPSVISHYSGEGSYCVSYDLSFNMLKCARFNHRDNTGVSVNHICGDIDFMPFQENTFDIITANAVFHHLPYCNMAAGEMNRVLKKGGIVAVSHEPNKLFFNSIIARLAASIYKIIGCGMKLTDELELEINRRLKSDGVIEKSLTKKEILKLAEFNSPLEQDGVFIDYKRGFSPESFIKDNFPGYEVLRLNEYSTFYHRPILEDNPFLMRIVKALGALFLRKRGNLFSFIMRKV